MTDEKLQSLLEDADAAFLPSGRLVAMETIFAPAKRPVAALAMIAAACVAVLAVSIAVGRHPRANAVATSGHALQTNPAPASIVAPSIADASELRQATLTADMLMDEERRIALQRKIDQLKCYENLDIYLARQREETAALVLSDAAYADSPNRTTQVYESVVRAFPNTAAGALALGRLGASH